MKKTVLSLILFNLCATVSVNTSAQGIMPANKKQVAPRVIIQETPQKAEEMVIANTPIQASQSARIPYGLNPQNFFDNQVTVSIPSTFVSADNDLISSQYPDAANLPKVVLTDKSKRPMLAMNISRNAGDRDDIVHFFRDIKNDIRSRYPTSRFLKTDVIRGRTLAILEVILPNKDGQMIYNMMAFRYVGENFFFLNFTCPEEDMATWQDTAREISENVRVNVVGR